MSLYSTISTLRGTSRKTELLLHLQAVLCRGFFVFLPSPKLKDSFINNSKASFNWAKLSVDADFSSEADTQV